MATSIATTAFQVHSAEPSLYRLTVEQYEQMATAGILQCGDPIELIEGFLIQKMPQQPPHASTVDSIGDTLRALVPGDWLLREQKPIRLSDSEPEPDLVIIRGPKERYVSRHPVPAEIALVIEVSNERLCYDREIKKRVYARAHLPIYWIINLPESKVEVYTQPRAGKHPTYRQCVEYGRNEVVPFEVVGQRLGTVAVNDLLPTKAS